MSSFPSKTLGLCLATAIQCYFSTYCVAQKFDLVKEGFAAKGYSFTYAPEGLIDEQILLDPIKGEEIKKVILGPMPVTIDGKKSMS